MVYFSASRVWRADLLLLALQLLPGSGGQVLSVDVVRVDGLDFVDLCQHLAPLFRARQSQRLLGEHRNLLFPLPGDFVFELLRLRPFEQPVCATVAGFIRLQLQQQSLGGLPIAGVHGA